MKNLLGPVGSRHDDLVIQIYHTWHPEGRRSVWCRGHIIGTDSGRIPVGFWTRSKRAERDAVVAGSWEVKRVKDEYTQLDKPRGLKWQK